MQRLSRHLLEQIVALDDFFIFQQIVAIGKVKCSGQIVAPAPSFLFAVYFLTVEGHNLGPDDGIIPCAHTQRIRKFLELGRLNVEKEYIRGVFR